MPSLPVARGWRDGSIAAAHLGPSLILLKLIASRVGGRGEVVVEKRASRTPVAGALASSSLLLPPPLASPTAPINCCGPAPALPKRQRKRGSTEQGVEGRGPGGSKQSCTGRRTQRRAELRAMGEEEGLGLGGYTMEGE